MASDLFFLPGRSAINLNGFVASGAVLSFFATGTGTPLSVFADAAMTQSLGAAVTANAAGKFPDIYIDSSKVYRVTCVQDGVTLFDVDPYYPGDAAEATDELIAASLAAVAAAEQAETARDVALTAGPYYASVAAGEAATTTGQEFAVAPGDGTVTWYRRTGGGSEFIFAPFLSGTGIYAAVAGEVGVVNPFFPVGDVRRYGVLPDGVTNWEGSFPGLIANIFQNSINPLILVTWPRGLYNTGINLTPTYNGSRMHFDHAAFANIVHVIRSGATPIEDVHWTGAIYSYDRLGIDRGTNIILPEYIGMLHNPAINPQGLGNRGVHFLGSENISWGLIDVFDTGPTQAALPGAQTIWSAFTIQSQGKKGFKGAVRVRNASGHGCYINALDVDLDLKVEGYGKSVIDLANTLEGADSEAQSEQTCGIWLNRVTGRVSLHVDQVNASPGADVYSILFDETGNSAVADSRHKPLQVDYLYATVGNGNRGVCVGEALAPSVLANVAFNCQPDIRLRASAPTLASTYTGFNVLPPKTDSWSYRRVKSALPITFHGFGAVGAFKATSASGTNVYVELDIAGLETPQMGAGRFAQFDGTGGVLRGRIGHISAFYDAGSGTAPIVDVDGCENLQILSGTIRSNSAVATRALRFVNNTDCSVSIPEIYNLGRSSEGAVGLENLTRCKIGPMRIDRVALGVGNEGIRFTGAFTDCAFEGVNVTNFGVGLENGTGMAFTRCSAKDCVSTGNTDDTDITLAQFPAANTLNCTNWAV